MVSDLVISNEIGGGSYIRDYENGALDYTHFHFDL